MHNPNQQQYEKVKKLITHKAHSFSRSTGYEVDELISQGNLIYCQTLQKYNPNNNNNAKFITLLYLNLDYGLINYTKVLDNQMPRSYGMEAAETLPVAPLQERSTNIKNKINQLSTEAQVVANVIINSPDVLFKNRALKPRLMYGAVRWYLKNNLSCTWKKTRATLDELRKVAYCN